MRHTLSGGFDEAITNPGRGKWLINTKYNNILIYLGFCVSQIVSLIGILPNVVQTAL